MNTDFYTKKQTFQTLSDKELLFIHSVKIIIIVLLNILFYLYVKLPSNMFTISVVLTCIMPLFFSVYNFLYLYYYLPTQTPEEALKELHKENLKEKKSSVSAIVFGLALFVIALQKKHIGSIVPFLIYSIITGLSIPEFLEHLIIDHDNLKRALVIENIEFAFILLSHGFLFMGFYLIIYYFTIEGEIKFNSLYR